VRHGGSMDEVALHQSTGSVELLINKGSKNGAGQHLEPQRGGVLGTPQGYLREPGRNIFGRGR
jgi:hypothetical protein